VAQFDSSIRREIRRHREAPHPAWRNACRMRRRSEEGYFLIFLMMMVTVLVIGFAIALLPSPSKSAAIARWK